jgi:hypothetical protein
VNTVYITSTPEDGGRDSLRNVGRFSTVTRMIARQDFVVIQQGPILLG